MAKLKKNDIENAENEVVTNFDGDRETVEETVEDAVKDEIQPKDGANFDEDSAEDVSVSARKTKVRLAQNHKCNIGGEMYDFKRGEVYVVPEDVKRVLFTAGLLTSL